jgi:hypothetical protein
MDLLGSVKRSSLAVQPSTGSSRPPCLRPFQAEAPLLGFWSPSAPWDLSATSPEVPPSGTAHVRGFSPPSRAFFRPILSELISSRKHSWGSPFRGFPSNVALSIRHRELPSCRCHGGHRSFSRVPRTSRDKGWLDFRVLPRPSPFLKWSLLQRHPSRSPPGFFPP